MSTNAIAERDRAGTFAAMMARHISLKGLTLSSPFLPLEGHTVPPQRIAAVAFQLDAYMKHDKSNVTAAMQNQQEHTVRLAADLMLLLPNTDESSIACAAITETRHRVLAST